MTWSSEHVEAIKFDSKFYDVELMGCIMFTDES